MQDNSPARFWRQRISRATPEICRSREGGPADARFRPAGRSPDPAACAFQPVTPARLLVQASRSAIGPRSAAIVHHWIPSHRDHTSVQPACAGSRSSSVDELGSQHAGSVYPQAPTGGRLQVCGADRRATSLLPSRTATQARLRPKRSGRMQYPVSEQLRKRNPLLLLRRARVSVMAQHLGPHRKLSLLPDTAAGPAASAPRDPLALEVNLSYLFLERVVDCISRRLRYPDASGSAQSPVFKLQLGGHI